MPPKRKVQSEQTSAPVQDDINSDISNEDTTVTRKPTVLVKYSQNDPDRIQLAQAINNLTIKSEQFMEALKSFDVFKENITQLDIQIDTKKKEFKEVIENIENNYKTKTKNLEAEYAEMHKQLQTKYQDLNKKLETEFVDKNKQLNNDHKNNQIEVKQKLSEYKIKACDDIAKEFNMILIKNEDHKMLLNNVQKANQELDEIKKSLNDQCAAIKSEERSRYQAILKSELSTLELNHKANVAELKAQVEQQKKEIDVLQKTIDNLKHEIAEQRTLTKEVAIASSKSQINQKFGKE